MRYSATITDPHEPDAMPMWESFDHSEFADALQAAQAYIHATQPADRVVEEAPGVYGIWTSPPTSTRVATLVIEPTEEQHRRPRPSDGAYRPSPPPLLFRPQRRGVLAKIFDRRRILHDIAPFRPQDGGVMRTRDGAVWIPEATPPVRPILGFVPRHAWQAHAMSSRSQVPSLAGYVEALCTELRRISSHLAAEERRRVLTLIGDGIVGDGTW